MAIIITQAFGQFPTLPDILNASDENMNTTSITDTISGGLALLVIDQQVDFHPGGALAIENANNDSERISQFINSHTKDLSQIILTLDSHDQRHIASTRFWINSSSNAEPMAFTTVSSSDIEQGLYKPINTNLTSYTIEYTKALEKSGKFKLTLWPQHCVIGTSGHNIVPSVTTAVSKWVQESGYDVQYVLKGSNKLTEHYSALKAEYPLSADPATSLNIAVIESFKKANKVAICGEALSHCVNFTVRDLVDNWPIDRMRDLIIMTDCMSSVAGYEEVGKIFLADMKEKGLTITTTSNFTMQ